jgi:hypothetical protein
VLSSANVSCYITIYRYPLLLLLLLLWIVQVAAQHV